ncbi:MAG: hypothetical protein QNK78_03440 [Crocinitomicaceae bacterium]|nr:hypothetical protein [Crocinitomicaceae bacterium]
MTIKDASELREICDFPNGRAKDKVLTSLCKIIYALEIMEYRFND